MTPENYVHWLRGLMLSRPHFTNQMLLDLISDELKTVEGCNPYVAPKKLYEFGDGGGGG